MENFIIKTPELAISPQKINLVASLIRKKKLNYSLDLLNTKIFAKRGGIVFYKILKGVKKNIIKKNDNSEDFFVKKITVNRGRIMKKIFFRAKGRSDRIKKIYSLIKIEISKI